MKPLYISTLLLILTATSCYENIDNTPVDPEVIIETAQVIINTEISGSVKDIEGHLMTDYHLSINGSSEEVASDYFHMRIEDAKKKGQNIFVTKDGELRGVHTALLIENDINHLDILAHPAPRIDQFPIASASIDLTKELTLDISKAQLIGGVTDDILLASTAIDPAITMTPIAYDEDLHPLALESAGGFYFDISTTSGTPLEIDEHQPALLHVGAIDPQVNGLFVLNDATKLWQWVADVSSDMEIPLTQSGYYTWAKYTKGVFVEGVVRRNDTPVAYQPLQWTIDALQNTLCATEQGRWIGILPEKEDISLHLINPCGQTTQTDIIRIDNKDLSSQSILIASTEGYQYLNTTVLDCDGQPVEGGSQFSIDNGSALSQYTFANAQQDRWLAVCETFSIAAVDPDSGQPSTEVQWSPSLSGNIDFLSDCANFENGFSYINIRDDKKIYQAFSLTKSGNRTILESPQSEIRIIFNGEEAGTYGETQVNLSINDPNFGPKGYFVQCENSMAGCGITEFVVSHYDTAPDGQVRVRFSGEVWMQTLNPSVAGTFAVEGLIISKQ